MPWLLDHWWIANVVPYAAFNIWLVRTFERDEGKIEDSALLCMMYALGLMMIAVFIVWAIFDSLRTGVARLRFKWARRPALVDLWQHLLFIGIAIGLWLFGMLLYILDLIYMDYRPGMFERVTAPTTIAVLAIWLARFFRKGVME